MKDCTLGVEVRRTWSEKEMVFSIDGRYFPGTPDGMFEDWDGALTCVQVVRVPLVSEFSDAEMKEILVSTILGKVVKSQQWLRASHFVPGEFIIFCWLPFAISEAIADHAERAMKRIQQLDSRFTLRLRVPASVDSLFPALFACNSLSKKTGRTHSCSWSDVATYPSNDSDSGDEELHGFDITWDWGDDFGDVLVLPNALGDFADVACASAVDDDYDCEWDITWDQDPPHPKAGTLGKGVVATCFYCSKIVRFLIFMLACVACMWRMVSYDMVGAAIFMYRLNFGAMVVIFDDGG